MSRSSPWPARDAELRARWDAGESTGAIAAAMGLTKNAVVGRAHRLGLAARGNPVRRAGDGAPRAIRLASRAARESVAAGVRRSPAREPRPTPAPPPLARAARCCWPLWPNGAGREHPDYGRCCGASARLGSSYCPAHHARAHVFRAEAVAS